MSSKKNGQSNGEVTKIKQLSRKKISSDFILHSAVDSNPQSHVALGLSSNEILYFDSNQPLKNISLKNHKKLITGLKFSKTNPNELFSSSLDGRILVWDVRTDDDPVQTFYDTTDDLIKPLLCFDLNSEEKYICGGSELVRTDAFIIFWDRRSSKNLGGYWDSHTFDITHVQFHEEDFSSLASSSVDGLINMYDLTAPGEEDALTNVLSTDSTINKFCWKDDHVSCLTGTEEIQFWSTDEVSPYWTATRDKLSNKSGVDVTYLIDSFHRNNEFYLASGSNDGCGQIFIANREGLELAGVIENGHSDVIRTICYNQKGHLITGGEDGVLCTWKLK